jgi:hypothetical protein
MGMGMGVNPYPPVYMGDPMGLFLCRGYEYGVVIPGGYLPIAVMVVYSCLLSYVQEYVVEDVDGERTDWCPPPLPAEHISQLRSLGLL